MRRLLTIPLLLLWLLAPAGGAGLALHGLQHEREAAEAEPACGSCAHHAPVSSDQPTDDEPAPGKAPPCDLCEILGAAITLSPEWGGPSPVVAPTVIEVTRLERSIAPSLASVATRSRGPPIV